MKQIRAMMIGAHPDDCDFRCGGLALQYAKAGHKVKFLAMCDGSGGHHIMEPAAIAERRKGETQEVAKLAGIEYNVWDVTDCELIATLENRKRLVREIREFNPDVIFCPEGLSETILKFEGYKDITEVIYSVLDNNKFFSFY